MRIKDLILGVLPAPLAAKIRKHRRDKWLKKNRNRLDREYLNAGTRDVFAKIYQDGIWGAIDGESSPFCSGPGSHDASVVMPYVAAIEQWTKQFDAPLNAVDLGCGDFYVGSRIRRCFADYTACDIVPDVIGFNRKHFPDSDVDFRVADISKDSLPKGDVVLVRQVLQHLANAVILRVLPKLVENYDYLILTEHLPFADHFVPNADKATGPNIRLALQSGIVVTEPPFNLHVMNERILCEVRDVDGIIRTTAYQLK